MKTILTLLVLNLLVQQPDFSAIISAIQSGNTTTLVQQMTDEVEMTVGEEEGTYTKAEATQLLKKFFASNQPKKCSVLHNGTARDQGSHYCIGKLNAGSKDYRLSIYCKKVGEKYLIQEIRIEEE